MKKALSIIFLLALFTACGEKNYSSKSSKEKLVIKAVKDKDQEAEKEYEKILADLLQKVFTGDEKAQKEFEQWEEIQHEVEKKYNITY